MNAEQIYRKNKKKARVFEILTPIVWYLFLFLAFIFFCFTINNSVGNIVEILDLLDKDIYTGTELSQNYAYLVSKWGEWEIIGTGVGGLSVRYIDIGNALFSGLMVTFSTLTLLAIVSAIVLGKIMFPLLAKHFRNSNEEMVDLATLKSASQIEKISKRKEWF